MNLVELAQHAADLRTEFDSKKLYCSFEDWLCLQATTWKQRHHEVQTKYDELIFTVGNKYTGETRHETALRYIRSVEQAGAEMEQSQSRSGDDHG